MRVLQYGLGAIGLESARAVARTSGLKLAGGVDIAPHRAGRPLADLLGRSAARAASLPAGLRVASSLEEALRRRGADIVIHTTRSSLHEVFPQLAECAEAFPKFAHTFRIRR